MKKVLLVVLILLSSIFVNAQNIDSGDFHVHRNNLKNPFLRFTFEKKGRIVFLGGSITHNPGWRDSVCHYFQQKFPETEFDFINAGIPSMGSTPGAFRFEQDVLKNGPVDLLFEEAAVNDDTNKRKPEEIIRGMEGIVRHALTANPACGVVFMYFADPGKMADYRAGKVPEVIQLHEKVAQRYNIPSIHLAREVTARIDAGEFNWENDFKDLHPSPFGQNIYFQSIKTFLEKEFENGYPNEKVFGVVLPEAIDKTSYSRGRLVEPRPKKPIKGWTLVQNWKPVDGKSTRANFVDVPMLEGTFPGKVIKFHFKGDAVGIAVAAGPDAGIIEYSIDDATWKKQDLFTSWSSGLHLPWFYTLGSGLKPGNHVLQIRLTGDRNPESLGNSCRIRYFYYNGMK